MTPSNRLPAKGIAITECLRRERLQAKACLAEVAQLVEAGKFDEAHGSFWSLFRRLRRVVLVEEELLFPRLRAVSGLANGPIAVMRFGHHEIDRKAGEVIRALGNCDANWATQSIRKLEDALAVHASDEEGTLYDIVDQTVGDFPVALGPDLGWPGVCNELRAPQFDQPGPA